MANYFVKDAYGSVISIESSVIGSAHRQIISGNLTTTPSGNQSVSGTVGASIIGLVPVTFSGSPSISGAVTVIGTTNVSGSVAAFLNGTQSHSVYGVRNDAVASFLGADLTVRPIATDSAGRTVIKPFAPEEARVEGYITLTSTSVTTLVAATAGLRNYITDLWAANTGASATLLTFTSGGGSSVLGYTIVPAGGGSNLQGLTTPIRTETNATFGVQAATATSTLYVTVKGHKAP